jgi:hypothetical protein
MASTGGGPTAQQAYSIVHTFPQAIWKPKPHLTKLVRAVNHVAEVAVSIPHQSYAMRNE